MFLFSDERALGWDALSMDWEELTFLYLFFLICLVSLCLEKIEKFSNVYLMVVSAWKYKSWYSRLL